MKVIDFLKDKVIFLILSLFVSSFSAFLLYLVNANLYFMLFIPSVYLIGSILSLLQEFVIKNQYYKEMQSNLDNLDNKCLLSEVVNEASFCEGKILYNTLKVTNKSMNDEIARYRILSEEYREYIEMWVHEIKTPIAGIKLICENTDEKDVLDELERIDKFVQQALFYSRSNNVEKDYIIKKVNLGEFINKVLRDNAKRLIANNISIERSCLEHIVFADLKWMDFILQQLIDNSIKYKCSKINIYANQNENSISLNICDNGIGIPKQDVHRVFDKGFTGENGRRFGHSTGIGLYLCKKMCIKCGMNILIESDLGEGTRVEIIFPKSNMYF